MPSVRFRTLPRPLANRLTQRDAPRTCLFPPSAARWRSGYAEDCKSLHAGSIPARASTHIELRRDDVERHNWRFSARFSVQKKSCRDKSRLPPLCRSQAAFLCCRFRVTGQGRNVSHGHRIMRRHHHRESLSSSPVLFERTSLQVPATSIRTKMSAYRRINAASTLCLIARTTERR